MSNIKYPIKMISTDGDIIVEFTSVNEGTVIGGTFYEVGFHSDGWTPADEPTEWLPVVTNYEEDNIDEAMKGEMSDKPRTKEDDKQLDVVDDDIRTELAELRKDKARMDWIDRTVDGLSRRIVDSEMEDEWLQWDRRQTWLREE